MLFLLSKVVIRSSDHKVVAGLFECFDDDRVHDQQAEEWYDQSEQRVQKVELLYLLVRAVFGGANFGAVVLMMGLDVEHEQGHSVE
ncbi:hypothetical protein BpHYR1_034287 [Brachionus plicatilis]|uniref:Uncharacterized protein n=1 Tax=Brachionus plicatilis TaxID=10195 RepID=A0A3M7RVD4_BRAPC|nr:hypothetical protein BpHYR1_034287 [Brachionus plicatilis]